MKIVNNKNIFLITILMLVMLIFSTAYYTSESYRDYKEVQSSERHIFLIDKLHLILHAIEEEKSYSAVYMGSKKERDSKSLKVQREKVKNEIELTLLYVDKDLKFLKYKKILEELRINLNACWANVDILTKDYRSIFTKEYYSKVITSLVRSIQELASLEKIEQKVKILSYLDLVKLEENLNREESFISFLLSSSQKMTDVDLLHWENFIKNDVIPDFSNFDDGLFRLKLNNMIDSEYFSIMGELERAEVFVDAMSGEYSLPAKAWSDVFRKKIERIGSVEDLILSDIKVNINTKILLLKDRLYKFIFIFIFLLIAFLALIYMYSYIDKNSRFLSDTLNDIEADLDEKQRIEIKEVIKKNDTIEIYKFLANAIKEPSRAKDYFLANMSHEIRTPLNGIVGFTNILKDSGLKDEQKEFVKIIEESSNNLISIVNDILDFSKVSSGKVEFENVSFNVMEKFEASIDSYAVRAAQKDIELSLYIDSQLPIELMGDPTKISQVMINLLSNAIKFTNKNGEIKVSIEKHSESKENVTIRFSVKDSGIGITKKQQSKIFDAFSQADASTSRKFGGTGLGLSISSKFVDLMGGNLKVDSIEGEGSTFFFTVTLNKSKQSKERVSLKLNHLDIAYISNDKMIRGTSKNLETYVAYSGANFTTYSYSEILEKRESLLADIIFVERQVIKKDEDMEALLRLNRKIVLLTTTEKVSCNAMIKDRIFKVLYKPVNFSKVMSVLKVSNNDTLIIDEKVTKIDNIKSNKLFKGLIALVVEDNVINQKLIKNILNKFDITVTLANNGAEAFQFYQENSYSIIFMDIQMPIMSGVEATKKIIEYEQNNSLKHTPVVALTANVIDGDKEKYFSAGMDRYIKKPIDVKEIVEVIEGYFPIKSLRDSLHLENQKGLEDREKSYIILYKETELTGKIYSAVLNNLGYKVDVYSCEDKFLEQLNSKEYSFALFDAKPFRTLNSDKLVVDLIRESGAIPIAFVEKDNKSKYCATLKPVENVQGIEHKLMCS